MLLYAPTWVTSPSYRAQHAPHWHDIVRFRPLDRTALKDLIWDQSGQRQRLRHMILSALGVTHFRLLTVLWLYAKASCQGKGEPL